MQTCFACFAHHHVYPEFHCDVKPNCNIGEFTDIVLGDVVNGYARDATRLHAQILMQRFVSSVTHEFCLCSSSIFYVTLACLLISSKCVDDDHFDNGVWAQSLDISLSRLNALEIAFLRVVDWRADVFDDLAVDCDD